MNCEILHYLPWLKLTAKPLKIHGWWFIWEAKVLFSKPKKTSRVCSTARLKHDAMKHPMHFFKEWFVYILGHSFTNISNPALFVLNFLLVWIVSFFHWIAPKRGPGSFHGKRCEKQLPQTLKVADVAVDASDISTTSDKAPRTPWYICQISCCSLDLVYQFQRCCQFV